MCVGCHRDPTRRGLAITRRDGAWLACCVRTLVRVVVRPWSCFDDVLEPVEHGRLVAYLWTLRLPFWLVCVALLGWRFLDPGAYGQHPEPGAWIRPSLAATLLGEQLSDALQVWLLLMVPLGVPILYFFGGIVSHLCMSMTGPLTRSIGASMRAFGLAASVPLLVSGIMDSAFLLGDVSPMLWAVGSAPGLAIAAVILGVGLARSHDASLWRGFAVAVVPLVFLAVSVLALDALVLTALPGDDFMVEQRRVAPRFP